MANNSKMTMKASRSGSGPRRYTFEVSLGGLITLSVAVVLGLAWVFILGVLLGRGYQPEKAVPEIAKIMPETTHKEAIRPEPEVIRPEELTFPQEVRKAPAPVAPVVEKPAPKPAPKAEAVTPPAPKPEPASPAEPRHRYLFQTASFVKQSAAQSFQKTMRSQGLSAFLEEAQVKGRTWYRVLVAVEGTEADASNARDILQRSGVDKPILRSKKKL